MLKVIKRSGAIQPFDQRKIRTSILNASRDAGMQINDKEARLLSEDVEHQLSQQKGKDGVAESFEVRSMVSVALREMGYEKVSELFERGRKDDLTDIQRHLQAIDEHTKALEELAIESLGKAGPDTAEKKGDDELDDDFDDRDINKTHHYKQDEE